ncbi:MAG: hypothetical protein IJ368_00875 [Oscillospiraceae bacterium]|nr:hypothetical protein [Oscillospiraceae bacterium]
MKKGPKTREDFEKESLRSNIVAGVLLLAAGIGIAVVSEAEISGIAVGVILGLVGLFLLLSKKIERVRERKLADENSSVSQKKRSALEAKAARCREKSRNHKGLRDEVYMKQLNIAAAILAVLAVLSLILLYTDGLPYVLIALDFAMLLYFIYTVTGHGYKKALKCYEAVGADKNTAEEDFKNGSLFTEGDAVICVGKLFVFFNTSGNNCNILKNDCIQWVFPRKKTEYNYYNGIYTGKSIKYAMVFCMADGSVYEFVCAEEAYALIIDAVRSLGLFIVTGWSDELGELYGNEQKNFKLAAAELTLPDIYNVQE